MLFYKPGNTKWIQGKIFLFKQSKKSSNTDVKFQETLSSSLATSWNGELRQILLATGLHSPLHTHIYAPRIQCLSCTAPVTKLWALKISLILWLKKFMYQLCKKILTLQQRHGAYWSLLTERRITTLKHRPPFFGNSTSKLPPATALRFGK